MTPSGWGREEAAHRDGSPYQRVRGFSYDRVFVVFRWTGSPYQRMRGFSYARGWTVVFFKVGGLQAGHSLVERMERGASRDALATLGMSVAPEAAASAAARYHGTARCG